MVATPTADRDLDGTPNYADQCPDDPQKKSPGACGCGKPDVDADSNGRPDCIETSKDNDNGGDVNPPPTTDCGGGGCGAAGIVEMSIMLLGFAGMRGRKKVAAVTSTGMR